jgi:hypothetical protein
VRRSATVLNSWLFAIVRRCGSERGCERMAPLSACSMLSRFVKSQGLQSSCTFATVFAPPLDHGNDVLVMAVHSRDQRHAALVAAPAVAVPGGR